GPLSPLKAAATVCLELADDSSKPFRSLVAPLCLAQALVVSIGHQLADKNHGKSSSKSSNAKSNNVKSSSARTTGTVQRRKGAV
ncbi:MAG: hypothetical protein ABIP46_00875, partial [Polaromonas sp.]